MTMETIALLKELITEKESRLAAISKRLDQLRLLVTQADTVEEIRMYGEEVQSLGNEITELVDSKNRIQREINKFFKPAA